MNRFRRMLGLVVVTVAALFVTVVHANRHPQYSLLVIYYDLKVFAADQYLATMASDAEVRSDFDPVRRRMYAYFDTQQITHDDCLNIIDDYLIASNKKVTGFLSTWAGYFNKMNQELYTNKMLATRQPKAAWNLHYYTISTALASIPDTNVAADLKQLDAKLRAGNFPSSVIGQISSFRASIGQSNSALLKAVDRELQNQLDVWWKDNYARKATPDGEVEKDGPSPSTPTITTVTPSSKTPRSSGPSSASSGSSATSSTASSASSKAGSWTDTTSSSPSESTASTTSSSSTISSSEGSKKGPTSVNGVNAADSSRGRSSTTAEEKTKDGDGFNMVLLVPIIGGVLVVCALAYWFGTRRRRQQNDDKGDALSPLPYVAASGLETNDLKSETTSYAGTTGTTGSVGTHKPAKDMRGSYNASTVPATDMSLMAFRASNETASLWNDSIIQALRIPLDLIEYGPLISRGGYGEVFHGRYKDQEIAIKRLLPERRRDMEQITGFMGEIKVMASMEHERIVRFIGVAWDSLAELCMITEYMSGGDLRSVVTRWEQEGRAKGFDTGKIKIALHVAHALTYMHSLQPVVLHRDLKSKNILLSRDFDAKLIDFGIARERADITMTGGVGTSRWMAPEVMLGERYDEKADIFSFGVVLSELDTHELPYANAQEPETGIRVPETAILQLVALGRLTVAFSKRANPEMVALARECIALEPRRRPTAATVLHRVHEIMLDEGFDI